MCEWVGFKVGEVLNVKNYLTGGVKSGKFAAALESYDSGQSVSFWGTENELFENDVKSLVFQTYPEVGDTENYLPVCRVMTDYVWNL